MLRFKLFVVKDSLAKSEVNPFSPDRHQTSCPTVYSIKLLKSCSTLLPNFTAFFFFFFTVAAADSAKVVWKNDTARSLPQ